MADKKIGPVHTNRDKTNLFKAVILNSGNNGFHQRPRRKISYSPRYSTKDKVLFDQYKHTKQ